MKGGLPVGRAPVTPNPLARESQARAGRLGGHARAAKLTPGQRTEIATKGSEAAMRALAVQNTEANRLMDLRVQELAAAIRGSARGGQAFSVLDHFKARGWTNESGIRRRFNAVFGLTPHQLYRASLGAGAEA